MERGSHDSQLITTKLAIPPTYLKKIISRPHLYAQMDSALRLPLLLLSASAGFGKTTLVSEWLRQNQQLLPAWVSLEQTDNDPIRFWRYIITALDQHHPGLLQLCQNWSQTLHPANIETTLTTIINSLMSLQQQTVLILDNYHTITNMAIHDAFTFLLEHLPLQLHVILITRSDPALPLARFRVQGKLTEIRTTELRFTPDETHAFLTQTMDLNLAENEILELSQRAEGWIAGLQLAALSLQGRRAHPTISHFIHTFTGTNRNVLNYLTDEVLIHQPEDIQNFLLQTSILEHMNAALCDAVTEQSNGEKMLERLEQDNLFLTSLDNQQQWYRYDRLFAEFLRYRLKQNMPPTAFVEQHRRAYIWYDQHNMISDAIKHMLAAGDIAKASSLIEIHTWSFMENNDDLTVHNWLMQLPAETIMERPILSFLYAKTRLFQDQLEDSEQALARAETVWQQERNMPMLGNAYTLRAELALLQEDGMNTIIYAYEALNLVSNEQLTLYNQAMVSLGAGYLIQGDIDQANHYITESYRLSQRQHNLKIIQSAILHLGELQIAQGSLRAAVQTFQQILIEPPAPTISWYHSVVHTYLADIYREWNDIPRALEHSQQAMQLAEETQHKNIALAQHYLVAAKLAWLSNDYEQAIHYLDEAEQYTQSFEVRRTFFARLMTLRIHFLLSKGDRTAAQYGFTQYAPTDYEDSGAYEREAWIISQARLLIHDEQGNQAISLLEEAYDQAKNQKRIQSQIMLLVLLTLAHHADGNAQSALQYLEQALILAEPGGYTRIFVDEEESMLTLLTEIYNKYQKHTSSDNQNISLGYIYTILNSFGAKVQSPIWIISQEHEDMLIDKLSEREYMVLGLIAEGLSNQEIAQKLVVTVSTIKTHLNNIYAKLHVHTRLQAVTKAYDLGVLRRNEIDTELLSHPRSIEKL
jgi:LuxR family transcriptional regulator, maltose regulon positive regulatory protein